MIIQQVNKKNHILNKKVQYLKSDTSHISDRLSKIKKKYTFNFSFW